jgi:hypothetical protein
VKFQNSNWPNIFQKTFKKTKNRPKGVGVHANFLNPTTTPSGILTMAVTTRQEQEQEIWKNFR